MKPIHIVTALAAFLSACTPPAADGYTERDADTGKRKAPADPLTSPDTSDALWAPVEGGNRLLFGIPGERAFLALACEQTDGKAQIRIVRNARADARAQALFALIGNGHVERLPMDASWTGKEWRWEGVFPADDPRLNVFTGPRMVEATLPGAGTVTINSANLPTRFIARCRDLQNPTAEPDQ